MQKSIFKQRNKYKIRNWSDYNRALIQRGSINVWIEEEAIEKWHSEFHSGKAGRTQTYSDDAILMLLILREKFKLTLRSLEGFAKSILSIMKIDLKVPCYTQICRRAKTLHKKIKHLSKNISEHLILDSTGLKVYGEGEWKTRTHGKSKRRIWRKLHIVIDMETQDIMQFELTDHGVGEAEPAIRMMDKVKNKVKTVRGDGAYDPNAVREKIFEIGARAIIPPPRHASIKEAESGWVKDRDEDIKSILSFGTRETGRRLWKESVKYYMRSLVETAMYRIKTLFGDKLKSRLLATQRSETLCKLLIINKMNQLGMPKGEWIKI